MRRKCGENSLKLFSENYPQNDLELFRNSYAKVVTQEIHAPTIRPPGFTFVDTNINKGNELQKKFSTTFQMKVFKHLIKKTNLLWLMSHEDTNVCSQSSEIIRASI